MYGEYLNWNSKKRRVFIACAHDDLKWYSFSLLLFLEHLEQRQVWMVYVMLNKKKRQNGMNIILVRISELFIELKSKKKKVFHLSRLTKAY